MLDKKPYVILSDITESQNQCSSSLPHGSEPRTNEHEEMEQGETNDHFMGGSDDDDDDDEEMDESESEDTHIESDIDNIIVGLYGSQYRYKVKETPFRFRSLLNLIGCHRCLPLSNSRADNKTKRWIWKDLRKMLTPVGRKQLEPMLQSYRKVVGDELSERMVYELR